MCLIVFAWKIVPDMPLMAAANRDEFLHRASAPAAAWLEHPQVFGGRDLQAGGSWMGVSAARTSVSTALAKPEPRFAAITNIRGTHERRQDAPSRGALVADYLAGTMSAQDYIAQIKPGSVAYNGFNLVLGDRHTLIWFSNRGQDDVRNGMPLAPGIYGLSNALLDSPWPKVLKTKAQFASLLYQGAPNAAYFDMLADTERAPDHRLPETGVTLEFERILSAVCIAAPGYGTRSSTVVKLHAQGTAELHEVLFEQN